MLLEFRSFKRDALAKADLVHINPEHVASVQECERLDDPGREHRVAEITMLNGRVFVVDDDVRCAAPLIRRAVADAAERKSLATH